MLALAMCLVSCNKEESQTVEQVRKLTFDGRTYELQDNNFTFSKDSRTYSISSCVTLEDGYSTVFMCMFQEEIIGKTLDQLKGSKYGFYFRMNGILPYKGEMLYGGEVYVTNLDGEFSSGFKTLDFKVTKSDKIVSVKVKGTLNMGADIAFQTYFDESELTVF